MNLWNPEQLRRWAQDEPPLGVATDRVGCGKILSHCAGEAPVPFYGGSVPLHPDRTTAPAKSPRVSGPLSEQDVGRLRTKVMSFLPDLVQTLISEFSSDVRYLQLSRELATAKRELVGLRAEMDELRQVLLHVARCVAQPSVSDIVERARLKAAALPEEDRARLLAQAAALRRSSPHDWSESEIAEQVKNFVKAEIDHAPSHADAY